jgi:hypothetical protein
MADIYSPTYADMKLPDQTSDIISRQTEVPGLKNYASGDALVGNNIADDIATGTHTGISRTWQVSFGDVDGMIASNISQAARATFFFGNNISQVTNWAFTPTS